MKKVDYKICLVSVDVRSAHNIGAFFRSCDGFGAELFIIGTSPRPAYDDDNRLPHVVKKAQKEIAKTAIGAETAVVWRYADTLLECITQLQKENYYVAAIEQDTASSSLSSLPKNTNIALVVGREVEGLSDVEKKLCDGIFEIPMYGGKESFNVSVAAGIALYESRR